MVGVFVFLVGVEVVVVVGILLLVVFLARIVGILMGRMKGIGGRGSLLETFLSLLCLVVGAGCD